MLTYLYFVLGFVVLIVVWTIALRVRTRRIAEARAGENYDTFRSSFGADEASQKVLGAVYSTFQKWCLDAVAEFPVRATDDIGVIYGMVNEDLEDAVLEVLTECARRLPPAEQLERMRPIVTVRDFVLFVVACPEATEPFATTYRPRE